MRRAEQGITLVEILVALAIFAVVAVGTLGALGVANVGGLLEGFPVAFATNRTAKDITAATVYVQGLQEHLAKLGAGSLTPNTYSFTQASSDPFGFPKPSSEPYQLNWTTLVVVIEEWGWNSGTEQYVLNPGCTSDCLIRVESTLTWQLKNSTRTVTVERFLEPNP